jgi:hypothetical protein
MHLSCSFTKHRRHKQHLAGVLINLYLNFETIARHKLQGSEINAL